MTNPKMKCILCHVCIQFPSMKLSLSAKLAAKERYRYHLLVEHDADERGIGMDVLVAETFRLQLLDNGQEGWTHPNKQTKNDSDNNEIHRKVLDILSSDADLSDMYSKPINCILCSIGMEFPSMKLKIQQKLAMKVKYRQHLIKEHNADGRMSGMEILVTKAFQLHISSFNENKDGDKSIEKGSSNEMQGMFARAEHLGVSLQSGDGSSSEDDDDVVKGKKSKSGKAGQDDNDDIEIVELGDSDEDDTSSKKKKKHKKSKSSTKSESNTDDQKKSKKRIKEREESEEGVDENNNVIESSPIKNKKCGKCEYFGNDTGDDDAILVVAVTKGDDVVPIRSSGRKSAAEYEARQWSDIQLIISGKDCQKHSDAEFGLELKDYKEKGRGIESKKAFRKGDFVVEYTGELVKLEAAKDREEKYAMNMETGCFMFYFNHGNKNYCMDATKESGGYGRLVNHSRKKPNLRPNVVTDDKGKPRLVFVAKQDIPQGTEVLFDYNDRSRQSALAYPWLNS